MNNILHVLKKGIAYTCLVVWSFQSYAQSLPAGFSYEKVAPIDFPCAAAIAPDGRIFVCSNTGGKGIITIVKSDGSKVNFGNIPNVYTNDEKGLIGLTFDPAFASNNYIYLYYTVNLVTPVSGNKPPIVNVISRITANGDQSVVGSLTELLRLDTIPGFLVNPNHDGGALHFGNDGLLYVAVGDNTLWCNKTCVKNGNNIACSCGPTFIPPTWSGDLDSFHGKILRINKDGSAPTDNPFYAANVSRQKQRVYAYGVRNPFTAFIRKGTNDYYFNDVGSSDPQNGPVGSVAREEINKIAYSLSNTNKNYGWDGAGTPGSKEGYTNIAGYVSPLHAYPHGPGKDSGCAIVSGFIYEPSTPTFPDEYIGKYFFMDYCNGWIRYMDEDGSNVKLFATGFTGGTGSDSHGSIYLTEGTDGNIYHLVRSGTAGVSGLYRIKGSKVLGTKVGLNNYAFSLHPNPADEVLNIHFTGQYAEPGNIIIYDILSHEKMSFEFNAEPGFNDKNFNIANLERGVYYVHFKTPNTETTQKLVVQ